MGWLLPWPECLLVSPLSVHAPAGKDTNSCSTSEQLWGAKVRPGRLRSMCCSAPVAWRLWENPLTSLNSTGPEFSHFTNGDNFIRPGWFIGRSDLLRYGYFLELGPKLRLHFASGMTEGGLPLRMTTQCASKGLHLLMTHLHACTCKHTYVNTLCGFSSKEQQDFGWVWST